MARQTIGEFLATMRKANGYTQQEVADRLGISNRTLSGWECDNVYPDILLLPVLAELYGVTVDEILAGERKSREREEVAVSSKAEKNIYRHKLAKFSLRAWILTFFVIVGLVIAFLSVYDVVSEHLDFEEAAVYMFICGLAVAAVCFSLLFIFWNNAEISVDDSAEHYPLYCIMLRKKLVTCLYVVTAWTFGQALLAMYSMNFDKADAMYVEGVVIVAACFAMPVALHVCNWSIFRKGLVKFGGEKARQFLRKDINYFFAVAFWGLIPAVVVIIISVILVYVPSISLASIKAAYIVIAVFACDIVVCTTLCVRRRLGHYAHF